MRFLSALRRARGPAITLVSGVLPASLVVLILAACAAVERTVCLEADGEERCFDSQARAVNEALAQGGVSLGERDRVEPSYWDPLPADGVVRIVRVAERTEVERQPLPFARHDIPSLGLQAGEQRLLQPGKEGVEELTYLVTLEDGVPTERRLASRAIAIEPIDELVAVGVESEGQIVPLDGTIAYLALGNAWVMRGSSGVARPLTLTGDLDGRVFELSPDGATLLFSRRLADVADGLNTLWSIPTGVANPEAQDLGVADVLAARWSPDGRQLAYSRGERTEGSPGWRALNDVWLLGWLPSTSPWQLRAPGCGGPYCWWGIELEWTTDGSGMLVAEPSALREVRLDGSEQLVAAFPPAKAPSSWVWVPRPSAHPAGGVVALAWHRAVEGTAPEDSPSYDVSLIDLAGGSVLALADNAGMWSRPLFSRVGADGAVRVAYAVAAQPVDSANSDYSLWAADADGSDERRLYPKGEGPGARILDFAWSPDADSVLLVDGGDLYLCPVDGAPVVPVLRGVEAVKVRWAP